MLVRGSSLPFAIALVLVSKFPPAESVAASGSSRATAKDADACSLLTEASVNSALEGKTQPGQHAAASSTKSCIWSADPKHTVDHRRVTLSLSTLTAFKVGKTVPHTTPESVAGIGDEAYYMIYDSHEAPTLVVRKGDAAFNIRLLNGLKEKELPLAEVKARELSLAKEAAAKL